MKILMGFDPRELRCGHTNVLQKRLLDEAILGDFEGVRRRIHWNLAGQQFDRRNGDILKLVRHDMQVAREALQRVRILIAPDDMVCELSRRRVGRRVQNTEFQPERIAG